MPSRSSGLDPGDRGTYTSLLSVQTAPRASYYDVGAARRTGRTPNAGRSISIADTGEGPSKDAGIFSSIAISADGTPIIAHHDRAGTLAARWNGQSSSVACSTEVAFTVDTGTEEEDKDANVGQFVRLRVVDGKEYMAHYDAANGDLKFVGNDIEVRQRRRRRSGPTLGSWATPSTSSIRTAATSTKYAVPLGRGPRASMTSRHRR